MQCQKHKDDDHYFWDWHLPETRGLILNLLSDGLEEVNEDSLVHFLRQLIDSFHTDDQQFDIEIYQALKKARIAAAVYCARVLLYFDEDRQYLAVYLLFLAALLEEIFERGPTFLKSIFDREGCSFDDLHRRLYLFHNVTRCTQSRSSLIKRLIRLLSSTHGIIVADEKGQTIIDSCVNELQAKNDKLTEESDLTLHSLPQVTAPTPEIEKILMATANFDSKKKYHAKVYEDMSLSWWLRRYSIQMNDGSSLRCDMPVSTNFHTLSYGGREIDLTTSGGLTIQELGLKNFDEIRLGKRPTPDKEHKFNAAMYQGWLGPGSESILPVIANAPNFDINEAGIRSFLQCNTRQLMHKFDKDLDCKSHANLELCSVAACMLAADYLLKGQNTNAAYMLLYLVVTSMCGGRGQDQTKQIITNMSSKEDRDLVDYLCAQDNAFQYIIDRTTTRSKMICALNELSEKFDDGSNTLKCLAGILQKEEEEFPNRSNPRLHTLVVPSSTVRTTAVTISKADSGSKHIVEFPSNVSLIWLLRFHLIECLSCPDLKSPQITKTTKYYRALHNGHTLFLSSSGKKTLQDLGIQDGDELHVGGVHIEEEQSTSISKVPKQHIKNKKKTKHKSRTKKKQSQKKSTQAPNEKQIMEKCRQVHSLQLSRVFEEVGTKLKEIRTHLNDLGLEKSAPKAKYSQANRKKVSEDSSVNDIKEDCLGGKAGRVIYPVLVGESASLYKTTKTKKYAQRVLLLDLHGCSKDEALSELNVSLPGWIDIAMKGDDPWVIPVDILCGGGSQTLSGVVRNWIRSQYQVANRPKGYL